MQFDELDKKIKEAAEQHHPAYDEQAWQKMEKMLNKHLPNEEKDRKRLIIFLLFFLLLGGGLFILFDKPWQKNVAGNGEATVSIPANQNQVEKNQPTNQTNSTATVGSQENSSSLSTSGNQESAPAIQLPSNQSNLSLFEQGSRKKDVSKNLVITGQNLTLKQNENREIETPREQDSPVKSSDVVTNKSNDVVNPGNPNSTAASNNKDADPSVVTETKNPQPDQKIEPAQKNKSGNKKFLDGFSFSLSAGPDVSKAGSSKLGTTTVTYGAGIGYTWNRFTFRTGVYAGRKVYSAKEEDYDLSYPLPQNIKFEGADARCRVLEIPFSLSYNFAQKKNSGWFAGAGLSSYLMKEEDYTYWYSNSSNGTYYPKYFEYKNKNKHYFSIVNLSVGYTRKLNNTISLTAEPYIRIPFQGIGAGKVQLNSGGILFSVGVQPFGNKKK